MPAKLDRCVRHVMDSGKPESNAYAICRSQLGLKEDGSEDEKELTISDEELDKKLIEAGYPVNPQMTQKIEAYGGKPAEPQGIPKAAVAQTSGDGADKGRQPIATGKPGPAKHNPDYNQPPVVGAKGPGELPDSGSQTDMGMDGRIPQPVAIPSKPAPQGPGAFGPGGVQGQGETFVPGTAPRSGKPVEPAEGSPQPGGKPADTVPANRPGTDPRPINAADPVGVPAVPMPGGDAQPPMAAADTAGADHFPGVGDPHIKKGPSKGPMTRPDGSPNGNPTAENVPMDRDPAIPEKDAKIDEDGEMEKAAGEKRKDVSPEEGKSKYGDVDFADETNKKYPIDTEAHIRSAWNYINKASNAAKYKDNGAAIKRKIIAAWKKKIDPEGPPSAKEKSTMEILADSMRARGLSEVEIAEKMATVFFSAPSLAPHVTKAVLVGDTITFPIQARNFTGDSVTLKVDPFPLPAHASFDATSGVFEFTPDATQIGSYDFVFTASDGINQLSQSVIVTVEPQPATKPGKNAGKKAPSIKTGAEDGAEPSKSLNGDDLVFHTINVPEAMVGCPLTFIVSGQDLDGDPVQVQAEDGTIPEWAEYDPDTGVFHGTPTKEGSFTSTFILTDGKSEKRQTITVEVEPRHDEEAEIQAERTKAAADMQIKLSTTLGNAPVVTKDIVVARAGRNFVNGEEEFDLTTAEIDGIIKNFSALKKQVPLLLTPTHVFGGQRSNIPAAGWVESMYRQGDEWHARAKFIGEAATMVLNDQFRGVSIGTVMGRDVHGQPVGEALDHLLITNTPFFPDLNIAAIAASADQDPGSVRYITSLKGETKMPENKTGIVLDADPKIAAKEAEIVALKGENLRLQEENETLRATLDASTTAAEKEALAKENAELRVTNFAMKVRALVDRGLAAGTLKTSWCDGYAGKNALDVDGTLRWLRASRFYDANAGVEADAKAFQILRWAVENNQPIYRLNQQHATGKPVGSNAPAPKRALTDEERTFVKKLGLDPDRVAAMPTDRPVAFDEWKSIESEGKGK